MANVLAFAEARGGALRKIALETVSAARTLADATGGGEVHAMLIGPSGVASHASKLGAHGADVVVVTEHAAFADYNPEAASAALAARAKSGGYRAVLLGASAHGRDLAPRVAAKLGAAMLSDVVELQASGDTITAKHPAYAGKVIATVQLGGSPALLTLRPNAFAATETGKAGRVETVPPVGDPSASRVKVTETIQGNTARPDLAEAPIIVSGGRGLKAPENFKLVEALAEAFGNAAVGATRAVTDEGWRPHSDQIGQTGRVVSPDLYVAVGISGAIQHLAGMRTSRTIVAINKDREAPIFKIADYGIVGDALEIVPVLTEAVKGAKQH